MPPIMADPQMIFDPTKQTYLEYLNSLTGYGQAPSYNSFPAQTNQPRIQPQQQKPQQAPPVAQGAVAANGIKNIYDVGEGATNWLNPSIASAPATNLGTSAATATPGSQAAWNLGATGANPTALAADEASAANAASSLGETSSLGSVAAPLAVGAIGAYTASRGLDAYNKAQGQGIEGGFKQGVRSGGALNYVPILGQAPWIAGAIGGAFGGKKDMDQQRRDLVRADMKKSGWLDQDFQAQLPDISLDLGKDGGFKYTNAEGEQRHAYDIDWKDPKAAQAVGWLQPLAAVLGKGDPKLTGDFTGQIYNELTKDGSVSDLQSLRKRVVELYNHFQLKPSIVASAVKEMKNLDEPTRNAYLAAIDSLKPGRKPQITEGVPAMTESQFAGKPRDTNVKPLGMGGLK